MYGVPQGSILGLLLFILYINNLSFCLKQNKTTLFADDTTVYISGNHITKLYNDINKELKVLADWFHANKLCSIPKCIIYISISIFDIRNNLLGIYT